MTQSQMMKHPQRRIMKRPICKRKNTTTTIPATTPTTTTTTTTLPCLPHDIIFFHILSKLPVRYLLRFNCVSKLWYNTIHHPNFHASHFTHAKSNSSLVAMLSLGPDFIRFLHLDHHHPNPNPNPNPNDNTIATLELQSLAYDVVGTCNGLTCNIHTYAIEISNPTTRELLEFPYPKATTEIIQMRAMVFNGFGFDPSMNEYKVIHLWLIGLTKDYECWVYTLGTNEWRNITATCNYQPYCYPIQVAPICISGNLFWRTTCRTRILSFDLHHEKFHLITCPQYPQGSKTHDLFEWESCPCLVYRRDDNLKDQVQLTLYTLKNYNSSLLHTKQQQQPGCTSSGARWIKSSYMCLHLKPAITPIRFVEFAKHIYVQWSTMDDHFVLWDFNRKRFIHNKLLPLSTSSFLLLVNHVENILSLKTFVPPLAGEVGVKYFSSREARHESRDHQQGKTKRKKHSKCIFDSNGYLIDPCWFSDIM